MTKTTRDRIRGSLVTGAVGDALGNPVEFKQINAIRVRYGSDGIKSYDLNPQWTDQSGKAVFTDDTQMTLFTAEGLIIGCKKGANPLPAISEAYLEWLSTQNGVRSDKHHAGVLRDIAALNVRRAPGNTCLSALNAIWNGKKPANNSKGCGGVMRIAPIPLYAAMGHMDLMTCDGLAGDAAAITHQHPLGFIPAALMADLIYCLSCDEHPTRDAMIHYVEDGLKRIHALYTQHPQHTDVMAKLAKRAITLADNDKTDVDNIHTLGGGWVGEEALAIAIYCAIRHYGHMDQALIAAVNHDGDSDSTGAMTGNILGAAFGYEAIPDDLVEGSEQLDVLLNVADSLHDNILISL